MNECDFYRSICIYGVKTATNTNRLNQLSGTTNSLYGIKWNMVRLVVELNWVLLLPLIYPFKLLLISVSAADALYIQKKLLIFFYISYSFQISFEGISNQTTWDKLIQAKVMGAYLLFRIPLCIDCNLWQSTSHFHWKNLMTSIFERISIKIFHNHLTDEQKNAIQ